MVKVGITGGIGSGKSTVASLIKNLGFPVYEADVEAKKIISEDEEVRCQIIHLLGEQSYDVSGYNRQYVAGLVFNDKGLLQSLNEIVHPAVAKHFSNWCNLHRNHKIVFQEAAILFENGGYRKFDKTILVTAPEDLRIKRVMHRDDISESEVRARIKNQWTEDEKRKLADFLIHCDGEHLVIPQVNDILKKLEWEY